jgi:hypothetical protein
MKQLTITEFIITIALLLGAAFAINYGLQSWLLGVTARTTDSVDRASRIYQ